MNQYRIIVDFGGRDVDFDAIVDAVDAQVVEPDEGQTFDVTVRAFANSGHRDVTLDVTDLTVLIAALDRQYNTWQGPPASWPGHEIRTRLAREHEHLCEGRH